MPIRLLSLGRLGVVAQGTPSEAEGREETVKVSFHA